MKSQKRHLWIWQHEALTIPSLVFSILIQDNHPWWLSRSLWNQCHRAQAFSGDLELQAWSFLFFGICLCSRRLLFRWSLQISWRFPPATWKEHCTMHVIFPGMLWKHLASCRDVLSFPCCYLQWDSSDYEKWWVHEILDSIHKRSAVSVIPSCASIPCRSDWFWCHTNQSLPCISLYRGIMQHTSHDLILIILLFPYCFYQSLIELISDSIRAWSWLIHAWSINLL